MDDSLITDVLVIGCGIAGGVAALQLADAGISSTVVTRTEDPHESNTYYAQGGIIYQGKDDSPALLIEDVIRAGAGHCNSEAVKILAKEGPKRVREILIDKLNVPFDKQDGNLSIIREASHSTARIVHSADITGQAITSRIIQTLQKHPNINLLTSHTAVDLLTPSHHSRNRLTVYDTPSCTGAYLLDQSRQRVIRCVAKNTILAGGGLGRIFLRTTNPASARGDGLAMAYRAGARCINCEFVQFHPTTFYHQDSPRFLISEAVRGAGARIVHADGKPFMEKYDRKWKDLAPRDVVARSIHSEMLTHGTPHVYLDLCSYIPRQEICERFPTIYRNCQRYGVDITDSPAPVVPAAHYFCGGVWCNRWGRTTLRNLYAAGEVACTGVHGANRLGSTSLLEGLVWGDRAATDIKRKLQRQPISDISDIPRWQNMGSEPPDPVLIRQDMTSIRHIMWNYAGLVRTTPRLERAIRELRHLEVEIERFYRISHLTDDLIGLRNAVRAAIIVTEAAWKNKTSMGCHYRC